MRKSSFHGFVSFSSMVSLELSEFDSRTIVRGTLTSADVATLRHYYSRHLSVQEEARGYRIESASWVGTVQLPGGTIQVRPKVPVRNLLAMLLYAHELADLRALRGVDTRQANSLYEFLVIVLVTWVEHLIKRGLYREFLPLEEMIAGVRGKIIPHRSRLREGRAHCVYGGLGHSTAVNIVIKATLQWILSRDIDRALKMRVRSLLRLLGQVASEPLSVASFRRVRFSRLNIGYRKIIGLCRAIYDASIYDEQGTQAEFSGYMVSMERLFEEFLYGAIRRVFSRVTRQSRRDGWAGGDTGYLPSIKPDIVIGDRLVIDAKYYRSALAENGKVRSAHIYQMHTYMQTLNLDGVLVYPLAQDEEAPLPLHFDLPGGRTLWVAAIDLARHAEPDALARPLIDFLQSKCIPQAKRAA